MDRLLYFFYAYRAFFTFLILEIFCAWLIIENNQYQGAKFFNSSNQLVAGIITLSNSTKDFFSLREVNRILAEENASLQEQMAAETLKNIKPYYLEELDSAFINQYEFISARVVNSTTRMFKNHLTINKGSKEGIKPGMAVISTHGVVGKIKTVSTHFSVVTSVLHTDVMVSSRLQRTGNVGTVQWDGYHAGFADLKFIPRHVQVKPGDAVVTSGFNAVFPEGILIGKVEEISLTDEAVFYDIKISLAQDFTNPGYVYVVKNNLLEELEMLEEEIVTNK